MFDAKNYREAVFCFERAHLHHERDIAKAWHLSDEAKTSWDYCKAGDAFESVARNSTSNTDKDTNLLLSVDCFLRGGSYLNAARLCFEIGKTELSVTYYLKATAFDDVHRILVEKHPISEKLRLSARESVVSYYLGLKDWTRRLRYLPRFFFFL